MNGIYDLTRRYLHMISRFADGAVLSDKDYDYIRGILIKEAPQYEWRTAENYLRSSIERCMGDDQNCDLFTDDGM